MPEFSQLQFLLEKYFPEKVSDQQFTHFEKAFLAYLEWNSQINVISRKDIENLAERHFLHSLAIAKVMEFLPKTKVLDAGTGGGFPGVPLAIMFPETDFHLVDSRGKKITVVQNVVQQIELQNVQSTVQRVEQLTGQYDFVISRAVASMEKFIPWIEKRISPRGKNPLANGILYLRGGDPHAEMKALGRKNLKWTLFPLKDIFDEPFFEEKFVLHVAF